MADSTLAALSGGQGLIEYFSLEAKETDGWEMKKLSFLSGNVLKIIACVSMLADHTGYLFFPGAAIFRIIGRIALPIFAFMIAQGCIHTKNKPVYFLRIFFLGVIYQAVYFILDSTASYFNIFLTFSVSIGAVFAFQLARKCFFSAESGPAKKILSVLAACAAVAAVYLLNSVFRFDYGFWGCMLPVFASLFSQKEIDSPDYIKRLDSSIVHVLAMTAGLIFLAASRTAIQYFSLLAVPLLLLYSGKRGRLKMKYFFYIFYPAHLILLYGIRMLIAGTA